MLGLSGLAPRHEVNARSAAGGWGRLTPPSHRDGLGSLLHPPGASLVLRPQISYLSSHATIEAG
ncbi:protein of unknown function [Bradyrhizobium sp. ORS 285]|nr:protein of unknown function [Bradyrhizobium sp. ORS 285]